MFGVVALLVVVYFVIPFFMDGLSGGAIVARRVDDDRVPFVLDEARTRAEMPALARLLDAAAANGYAEDPDDALRKRGIEYLHAVARERTGADLYNSPHRGVVAWKSAALEVSSYVV